MSANDLKKLVGLESDPVEISYTDRDSIIYNLGIGAKKLRFLYEKDKSFEVIPTISTTLKVKGTKTGTFPFTVKLLFGDLPIKINPAMILHGEQETEIVNPLPVSGNFKGYGKVVNIYDKGKGALFEMEMAIKDASGKVYTRDTFGMYVRGAGNFGGEKGPSRSGENLPPSRPCDKSFEETTNANQAQLFRLNGDYNPLHIDPGLAKMVGFKAPILHGLSTYGHAARAIINTYCGGDASLLKKIRVRFASPVFPGDTIVTEMWKNGSEIIFRLIVKGTGKVALANAVATVATPAASSAPASSTGASSGLRSQPIFDAMSQGIKANPALLEKVGAVYQFNLTNGPDNKTVFTVDVKNKATAGVKSGAVGSADCVITMDDDDFFDMSTGKLDPMQAFGMGKIEIGGNMMLAQKLSVLTASAKM
eukprot:TRINITY_DN12437_c0_g1_i1.p1 TRINITY_DN12437_c0_g1~~TRINITY_DN12437_c0_g1_i1.p1  ORF type:complete len:421 (+),score=141.61 TRINITY_DN12437_c0_g1_i1:43-1305(+)